MAYQNHSSAYVQAVLCNARRRFEPSECTIHHEPCEWYYSPAQRQLPHNYMLTTSKSIWTSTHPFLMTQHVLSSDCQTASPMLKIGWSQTNFYWTMTKLFIAASPHHQKGLCHLTLNVNNTTIKPSQTVRNLGVICRRLHGNERTCHKYMQVHQLSHQKHLQNT